MALRFRFDKDSDVIHRKTGNVYRIVSTPSDDRLLESTAEPFYEYRDQETGKTWVRSQSEMEGGRFSEFTSDA